MFPFEAYWVTEAVAKLLYIVVDTICGGRGAFHCGVFLFAAFPPCVRLGGGWREGRGDCVRD